MRQSARPSVCALLVLLLPLTEYAVLRFFQREILGLRIGWPVGTDFDLFLPLLTVHFFAASFLFRKAPPHLRLRKSFLWLNFSLVAALSLFAAVAALNGWKIEGALKWFCAFSCIGIFATAYVCFLKPGYLVSHPNRKLIPVFGALMFSMFLFRWGFENTWRYLATPTSRALEWLAPHLIGMKITPTFFAADNTLLVSTREITLLIGKGCGGGEGFLIFILSCLGFALHSKQRSIKQWLIFVPLGLLVVFGLNVIRLALLLFLGVFLVRAGIYSKEIFVFWIHANVGWLLYAYSTYLLFNAFGNFDQRAFFFTRKRLLSSSVTVVLLLSGILGAKAAYPAGCSQACATSGDCASASCPICVGVCTGCADQGDSASCSDTGSGASSKCEWIANACVDVPELAGFGRLYLYLFALAFLSTLRSDRPFSPKGRLPV